MSALFLSFFYLISISFPSRSLESGLRTLAMADGSHKRVGLEWFDRLEIRLGCPGGKRDGGDLVELLTIGRWGWQPSLAELMATTAFSMANGAGESTERPSTTAAWACAGAVGERARQQARWQRGRLRELWARGGLLLVKVNGVLRQARQWRGRARGPSASATAVWSSDQARSIRRERVRRPVVARYGGGGGRGGHRRARRRHAPAGARRARGSPLHRTQRRHGRGAAARRACGGAAGAVETTGFSTTRFSSFPTASVRGRTSFLSQETISLRLVLFPHLLTRHVIFFLPRWHHI
jgi:hypothetical protein